MDLKFRAMGWAKTVEANPITAADAPKIPYRSHKERTHFIDANPVGFQNQVKGALYTGYRYGEWIRVECNSYNQEAGTVDVSKCIHSKSRRLRQMQESHAVKLNVIVRYSNKWRTFMPIGDIVNLLRFNGHGWFKNFSFVYNLSLDKRERHLWILRPIEYFQSR